MKSISGKHILPVFFFNVVSLMFFLYLEQSGALAQNLPTGAEAVKPAPAERAQSAASPAEQKALPKPTETMVVLAEAEPTPLAEVSRSVTVLPVGEWKTSALSPQDLLRSASSVFLQQRGGGGGQADVVLRGGSFQQTLVLVNGLRVNDSQTGHHNLDLPLPLEALDSIEVLAGAGSTLHGADALAGVVDFRTIAADHATLRFRAGGGSFASQEESLLANGLHGGATTRLAAAREASNGFMADRDYALKAASLERWQQSRLGLTDLLLASSDRSFGANQFYGSYASWERTKSWLATVQQQFGERTSAAFAFRRHTDDFVLLRSNPALYANNHADAAWQGAVRAHQPLRGRSVLLLGLEADGDSIGSLHSSASGVTAALGSHARNRGAGYADLDLRPAARPWTLSAGVRDEVFAGGARAFAPQLAGSWRVASAFKLRASGGYGFRIPSYTDLYYSDPSTKGNALLKPESAWSGEAGADWQLNDKFTVNATGFYARQHNTIDYTRTSSTATWEATNLSGLRFAGAELLLTWKPAANQTVRVNWTQVAGARALPSGLQSKYAMNYPAENAVLSWTRSWKGGWTMTESLQVAERWAQVAYPVWNATLQRDLHRWRPYLRLSNLTNTGYQEVSGVAMPGRSVSGGLVFALGR